MHEITIHIILKNIASSCSSIGQSTTRHIALEFSIFDQNGFTIIWLVFLPMKSIQFLNCLDGNAVSYKLK